MNHQLYNILTTNEQILAEYPELAIGLLNNTLMIQCQGPNIFNVVEKNLNDKAWHKVLFDIVFHRSLFWYRELTLSPCVGIDAFIPNVFPTIITIRI